MSGDNLVRRELFGGAIDLNFPERFVDISNFRQVPDHQEVFADANLDQSLVVEILELQSVPDAGSAQYFWEDLSANNEAASCSLQSVSELGSQDVPGVPADCYKSSAVGIQSVSKGRQGVDAVNEIQVIVAVLRLRHVNSELVISLNTPIFSTSLAGPAEPAGGHTNRGVHLLAPDLFKRILQTLRIRDWNVFGG